MTNENTNNQLAVRNNDSNLMQSEHNTGGLPIPVNQEQFEIIKEVQASDAALETLLSASVKPSQLCDAGVSFNILDAYSGEIPDVQDGVQAVVFFKLELLDELVTEQDAFPVGEVVTIIKSSNAINNQMATAFANRKAVNMPVVLENMLLVRDDRWSKAGNAAIVFRRVPKVVKAVTKK